MGSFAAGATALIVAAALVPAGTSRALNSPATSPPSPTTAQDRRLAASVMFGCADVRDTAAQRRMAAAGVSGIVLLGTNPPRNLAHRLRLVRRAAHGQPPLFASDEEGGSVQRLAGLLGSLPAARTMGHWRDSRIEHTARRYGRSMARLGVRMDLAPVADLAVPGSYMAQLGRSFGSSPRRVGRAVAAWSRGMAAARVVAVPKHWPGHGHAVDTHESAARIPALKHLIHADLVPFRMAFAHGAEAVMVGHLKSRGLTRGDQPATQSESALALLRRQAGDDVVIITDSLSMAAASSARGLTQAQAVVAALRAGADWAMICTTDTGSVVRQVGRAISSGQLDRDRLVASAARISALRTSVD